MAATFDWQEDTGSATGSPAKGATRTTGVTDVNWKNSGVQTDAYTSFPITAGNNSYEKWQFGKFTGSFNNILNGKFAHTSGTFGTGLTLKGVPSGATPVTYTTPSATANANLTVDMTSAISIASGTTVYFGATGPEASGKAASAAYDAGGVYTNYLTTQLQTTTSAAAGDTATVTLTLQYDEN